MLRSIYNRLGGVKGIFLILYLCGIFSADVFLSDAPDNVKAGLYILVFLASVAAGPFLIWLCSRLSLCCTNAADTRFKRCVWFLGFLLVALAVCMLRFSAYYPGAFSADCINQYTQAVTDEYSNWHPVLHTLLFFKLPLLLSGGWTGSVVLFQLLCFSAAIAYASFVILRHSNIPYAVLSLLFILLNPAVNNVTMFPWKDTPFAITAVMIAAYAANTYFTGGDWLRRSKLNIAAAVTMLVLATVFRHNGLLFTLPMLIAMLMYLNIKRGMAMVACVLAAVVLIEGPFYSALNVQQPDNRKTEALGLPMSVIGEVVSKNPDVLTDDIKEFAYKVAPEYYWKDYYSGDFNSIKFYPETDYGKVDEEGVVKVVGYMLYCFGHAPKESWTALVHLTDMVYTVTGSNTWRAGVGIGIMNNELGIAFDGNDGNRAAVNFFNGKLDAMFGYVFWYIGAMNLLLLVCMLSKLRFRNKKELKRVLMAGSMLLYNFVTMLLLSGDDFRIFFYTFPVTPVLLLIVLRDYEGEDNYYWEWPFKKKKAAIEAGSGEESYAGDSPLEDDPAEPGSADEADVAGYEADEEPADIPAPEAVV